MSYGSILNVNDNPAHRYTVSRLLRQEGFSVVEAASGTEALRRIAEEAPQLVILDIHLPDMEGYEVCRQIRENPATAGTLVLEVSAVFRSPEDRLRGLEGGADAFVVQPLDPREFIATVRSLLRLQGYHDQNRRILEREQQARIAAEAAQRRFELLASATDRLARSIDYDTTVRNSVTLALGEFADWCAADLLLDEKTIERAAVAHADPDKSVFADHLARCAPQLEDAWGPGAVIRTLKPELAITAERPIQPLAGAEASASLARLGLCSYVVVPLMVRGRVIGALSFVSARPDRLYRGSDLEIAEQLANRAALALEHAQLFATTSKAVRSRDEMLSIVSHDLRSPLHTILTTTALLELQSPDDERVRDHLDRIRRSAQQMSRLIRDLTDVVRLESGKVRLELETLPAADLLERARAAFEPIASARQVVLELGPAADGVLVSVDATRMQQVLSNLVDNALKFTPPGGSIKLSASPAEGGFVTFSVRDSGAGISPEQLSRIFDRFWQAEQKREKGLGLGLYIAQGIVAAHGGRIWAESSPGAGSTFCFTVPRSTEPSA